MATLSSFEYFFQPTSGRPVENGFVYFGVEGLDPEVVANQVEVILIQEDETEVVASQPIQLNAGGGATYNGSPVQIRVLGKHSMAVKSSADVRLYYAAQNALTGDDVVIEVNGSDTTLTNYLTLSQNIYLYADYEIDTGGSRDLTPDDCGRGKEYTFAGPITLTIQEDDIPSDLGPIIIYYPTSQSDTLTIAAGANVTIDGAGTISPGSGLAIYRRRDNEFWVAT